MSEADKMFQELGYEKEIKRNRFGDVWGINYINEREDMKITIDLIDVTFCAKSTRDYCPMYMTKYELKAISKKFEELDLL